ncbi:hypothetical protein ACFQX6_46310 [Streptosporangium lutulentum]
MLPGREITLELTSFCGKLIVRVPENAHVIDEVSGLFAKRHISGGIGGEGGPVIKVVGRATFGKIIVARREPTGISPTSPDRPEYPTGPSPRLRCGQTIPREVTACLIPTLPASYRSPWTRWAVTTPRTRSSREPCKQ